VIQYKNVSCTNNLTINHTLFYPIVPFFCCEPLRTAVSKPLSSYQRSTSFSLHTEDEKIFHGSFALLTQSKTTANASFCHTVS